MTPSFPHRMVAVIARIVLAVVEDLPAAVADIACLVAVPVSLWLLHRLIAHGAAWIGGHVATHRKQAASDAMDEAFAAIVEHEPELAEQLAAVHSEYRLASPPPRRELHRRPRRFPGRRLTRRSTTSSSFDRGHHS